jgi:hypothetical protein
VGVAGAVKVTDAIEIPSVVVPDWPEVAASGAVTPKICSLKAVKNWSTICLAAASIIRPPTKPSFPPMEACAV